HSKPEVVLPFLRGLLNDPSKEDMRSRVAMSIGCFRGEAKDAVPDLRKALKCEGVKDPRMVDTIRGGVLLAIKTIGPGAKDAIRDVLELFLDKKQDSTIRRNAIQAVAAMAPGSKETVTPLMEVLPKKEFVLYSEEVVEALAAIGEPSVEPLVKL